MTTTGPRSFVRQSARSGESEVHALVLMTNHVHLDRPSRAAAYRALFTRPFAQDDLDMLRAGIRKGCPIGSADFLGLVERKLGRCATIGCRGRPRQEEKGI